MSISLNFDMLICWNFQCRNKSNIFCQGNGILFTGSILDRRP